MLSLRYIFKLVIAFINRFKLVILLGIIIGIGIFFILRVVKPTFLFSTTEKIGLTGRYTPDSLPSEILKKVSTGLTTLATDGTVEPGLAKSWSTTDNGTTWVFYLDENIQWQDGKKILADSINYSFTDAQVEKPDDYTLVYKLSNPYSPFPSVVSKPVFKKGLLGNGEWEVKKVRLTGSFVQDITLKDTRGNKIIYKFYPTEERTKIALKLGKVQKIEGILNPEPFNEWGTVQVSEIVDEQNYVAIFFNTQDKYVGEKSLRQALNYALDKDKLGERALSPISPLSWAYNPQVKPYNYDPARAKELIAELPEELKADLNLKLTTIPSLLPVAEKISEKWNEIGIPTQVNVSPNVPSEYQIFIIIFQTPFDPDQYTLWHSTQTASNLSNFKSPRIDKLLEDGRQVVNFEERKKIYIDFQRYLVEDSPAIFLYHPKYYTVTKN